MAALKSQLQQLFEQHDSIADLKAAHDCEEKVDYKSQGSIGMHDLCGMHSCPPLLHHGSHQ